MEERRIPNSMDCVVWLGIGNHVYHLRPIKFVGGLACPPKAGPVLIQ